MAKARAEMAASMGKPNRPTMREKTETSLTMALSRDGKKVRPLLKHAWTPAGQGSPRRPFLAGYTEPMRTGGTSCRVLTEWGQAVIHMAEVLDVTAGVWRPDLDAGVPGCRGGQLARGRCGHPGAHRHGAGPEAGHQVLLPLAHE